MHLVEICLAVISFTVAADPTHRMILTNGKPLIYSEDVEHASSWDDCLALCYGNDTCLMTYQPVDDSICWMFPYGSVTLIAKEGSGNKIGLKSAQSYSVCPANNNPPFFGANSTTSYRTSGQYVYSTTISDNFNSTWKVSYRTLTCPQNTTRFIRGIIPVCLAVRYTDNAITQENASSLCRQSNGVISGPFDANEYQFVLDNVKKAPKVNNLPSAVWLDGRSSEEIKLFLMEDDTLNGLSGYQFYGGGPNDDKLDLCIYMAFNGEYADDWNCEYPNSALIVNGVVCRIFMKDVTIM